MGYRGRALGAMPIVAVALVMGLGPSLPALTYPTGEHLSIAAFGATKGVLLYDGTVQGAGSSVAQPTFPQQIAWNGTIGDLFIADGSGALVVVDPVNHVVVRSTWLGTSLGGLALDGRSDEVYVSEPRLDTVAVVNATSGAIVARIAAGASPVGIVLDPLGQRIYVADSGGDNLTVLDPATHRAVGSIPAGSGPTWLTVDPAAGRLFVADWGGSCNAALPPNNCSLLVLRTTNGRQVANLSVPLTTHPTYDPANGDVYLPNPVNGSVTVVSAVSARIVTTDSVPGGPKEAAVDTTNGLVYVTDQYAGNLSVIDPTTNRIIAATPATYETSVNSWVYVPRTGHLYGVDSQWPAVLSFSPKTFAVTRAIPLMAHPQGLVYDPVNGAMYVEDGAFCGVYATNGSLVPPFGREGGGDRSCGTGQPAVDPRTGTVFATTAMGEAKINITSGVETLLRDPLQPNDLQFDSGTGNLFGVNSANGSLSIYHVASDHVVRSFHFHGWWITGVTLDAGRHIAYAPMTSGTEGSYVDQIFEFNASTGAPLGNLSVPTSVGNETGAALFDPATGDLFVVNYDVGMTTNTLLVLNPANGSLVANVPIEGEEGYQLALDPGNGDLYATAYGIGGNTVSELVKVSPSTLAVLGHVTVVGSALVGVAVDTATGQVWTSASELGLLVVCRP
jgi:YVTN family beta-propeller protein